MGVVTVCLAVLTTRMLLEHVSDTSDALRGGGGGWMDARVSAWRGVQRRLRRLSTGKRSGVGEAGAEAGARPRAPPPFDCSGRAEPNAAAVRHRTRSP